MLTFKRTCDQEMSCRSGLTNQSRKIRADQRSRKRHRSQLVAMPDSSSSGSEGSQVSLRVTKRDNSKPNISPSCSPFPLQRIVTVRFSLSHVGFLKNRFVVCTKLLVDDNVVVEATESDAAVSWIADVSMAQQLTTRFSLLSLVRFPEKGFARRSRVVRWRRHVPRDWRAYGEEMPRELRQDFV